jgi:hypothetical protein
MFHVCIPKVQVAAHPRGVAPLLRAVVRTLAELTRSLDTQFLLAAFGHIGALEKNTADHSDLQI